MFVFYLGKWLWDVPNSLKFTPTIAQIQNLYFVSTLQFLWNYTQGLMNDHFISFWVFFNSGKISTFDPQLRFLPSRVIFKKYCTKFFDIFRSVLLRTDLWIWGFCLSVCLSVFCLSQVSESQIREVWLTNKFGLFWNDLEQCLDSIILIEDEDDILCIPTQIREVWWRNKLRMF